MKITIRPIEPEDIPAISELAAECHAFLAEQQGFSPAQLQRLLAERCTPEYVRQSGAGVERYVAESADNRIVGMVAVEGNDVAELWVLPKAHRQRVGARLFSKAEGIVRSRGYGVLTVRTTGYAIPFYQAVGAHITEKKACPNGPLQGWTLTHLEKPLNKTRGDNTSELAS